MSCRRRLLEVIYRSVSTTPPDVSQNVLCIIYVAMRMRRRRQFHPLHLTLSNYFTDVREGRLEERMERTWKGCDGWQRDEMHWARSVEGELVYACFLQNECSDMCTIRQNCGNPKKTQPRARGLGRGHRPTCISQKKV